jgi:hypothetical protein
MEDIGEMIKKLLILVLCLFPLVVHATKMTDFTEDTSPTSDDIFWTTNAPGTSPADRKVTLGNLLLWMATQTVSVGGTWTMTTPVLDTPTFTLADDSTLTLPGAAVDSGWTTGILGFGPDGTGIFVNIADLEATIPISGEITDEQVACWESSETPGTNKLKSCGAKTTDNSTATHLLCKDDSGEIENCTLSGLAISGTTSPTITVTSAPAIPSGTNPTVDAAGEIAIDTDGANVTGDMTLRVYDGAATVAIGRKLHDIHVTVVKPQDLADAVRDAFLFWSNETGMTFTITSIKCWAGTDDTTLNVEETDADGQNNTTVDAIECATNGTGVYTDAQTTFTGATIEAGHLLWLDFDDTDDPSFVKITVSGWFNAAVD